LKCIIILRIPECIQNAMDLNFKSVCEHHDSVITLQLFSYTNERNRLINSIDIHSRGEWNATHRIAVFH
jgi:adenylate cyclase